MKTVVYLLLLVGFFNNLLAQNKKIEADSTSTQKLNEVLIKSVIVNADSPITHSNIDKIELSKRNLGQDLPILLNQLPSVVTTSDAGAGIGYTYIRVRGSDASRVNITINGIPYNDAESQGTFWVNLPDFTSSVESIQLQRGVGTSTNGSGAFGASLNILSEVSSKEASAQISSSIGSFNTNKNTIKFNTGLLNNSISFSGRLSAITSDGYVDRARSDLKSYFLQAAYTNKNTSLKFLTFGGREETYQAYFGVDKETLNTNRTFNTVGQQYDSNGNFEGFYDNEIDNYMQDHYQLIWSQKFKSNWNSNLSLNYTKGKGFFEQYVDDYYYTNILFSNASTFDFLGVSPITINNKQITSTDYIRRRWLDNDFFAINANINYKKNNIDISSGTFYSNYTGDHFGEILWTEYPINFNFEDRYYDADGKKEEFTLFTKFTWLINNKLSIYADAQGRFITHTAFGTTSDKVPINVNQSYSFFNPKAGISYKLNASNQLYASYGRANREPRRSDFEENLFTPETLDDFELGWRFKSNTLTLNSNLYYFNYKNQLILTGQLDDVGAPIRTTSGKSYRLGIEIDAELKLLNRLKLRPNIAISENKNIDFYASKNGQIINLGNTNIAYSPSIVGGNIIEYKANQNFNLNFTSKFVGEQYLGNIDSESSKLNSYFINDINATYTLNNVLFSKTIQFTALINNIFNKQYVSNGFFFTFDDDFSTPGEVTTVEGAGFFPQAGINFLLGVTISF